MLLISQDCTGLQPSSVYRLYKWKDCLADTEFPYFLSLQNSHLVFVIIPGIKITFQGLWTTAFHGQIFHKWWKKKKYVYAIVNIFTGKGRRKINSGTGREVVFFVSMKKLRVLEITLWRQICDLQSAATPIRENAIVEMIFMYSWYNTDNVIDMSLG